TDSVAYRCESDSNLCGARQRSRERISSGMDTPKRQRFTRNPLRGTDLHRVLAVVSLERDDRRPAENPGSALPVLPQYGPLYHRFFSFCCFAAARRGSTSSCCSRNEESKRKLRNIAQLVARTGNPFKENMADAPQFHGSSPWPVS